MLIRKRNEMRLIGPSLCSMIILDGKLRLLKKIDRNYISLTLQSMKLKILIGILLVCLCRKELLSQKISSKYYSSPLIVNPANTGRFIGGDYRIAGVSRTEKNVLYQDITSSISFDTRILKSELAEQDRAAIGIAALSETDRYLGLKNNHLLISAAFFKGLDAEGLQQLSVGFQTNFSTRKLEPPTFIFADQLMRWESAGFAGIFSERQAITVNYVDINAGLSYQNLTSSKYLWSLGVCVLHANRPSAVFNGVIFTLPPQICLQAGIEVSLAERNKLLTNLTMDASTSNNGIDNLSIGCMYQMSIGQTINKFIWGSYFRTDKIYGPALSPSLGLKFNNTTLNVVYDISLSGKTSTQKNAFELGMVFIGRKSSKKASPVNNQ